MCDHKEDPHPEFQKTYLLVKTMSVKMTRAANSQQEDDHEDKSIIWKQIIRLSMNKDRDCPTESSNKGNTKDIRSKFKCIGHSHVT
jgi:hypothetical protein